MEDLNTQLTKFLKDDKEGWWNKSSWFDFWDSEDDNDLFFRVYARRSTRLIGGKMRKMLDLATIEVGELFRRVGVFKNVLAIFEQCSIKAKIGLYVENPNLCIETVLIRNGFVRDEINIKSYYRLY